MEDLQCVFDIYFYLPQIELDFVDYINGQMKIPLELKDLKLIAHIQQHEPVFLVALEKYRAVVIEGEGAALRCFLDEYSHVMSLTLILIQIWVSLGFIVMSMFLLSVWVNTVHPL